MAIGPVKLNGVQASIVDLFLLYGGHHDIHLDGLVGGDTYIDDVGLHHRECRVVQFLAQRCSGCHLAGNGLQVNVGALKGYIGSHISLGIGAVGDCDGDVLRIGSILGFGHIHCIPYGGLTLLVGGAVPRQVLCVLAGITFVHVFHARAYLYILRGNDIHIDILDKQSVQSVNHVLCKVHHSRLTGRSGDVLLDESGGAL